MSGVQLVQRRVRPRFRFGDIVVMWRDMARDLGRDSARDLVRDLACDLACDLARDLARGIFHPYRPELHYMRGPGPKWHAKYHANYQGTPRR